jgi:hypothetical protein
MYASPATYAAAEAPSNFSYQQAAANSYQPIAAPATTAYALQSAPSMVAYPSAQPSYQATQQPTTTGAGYGGYGNATLAPGTTGAGYGNAALAPATTGAAGAGVPPRRSSSKSKKQISKKKKGGCC